MGRERREAMSVIPSPRRGWTKERREAFLTELATSCNVKRACAIVGLSPSAAYALRRTDLAFKADWRRALSEAYARLELEMLERALLGEDVLRAEIDAREPADQLDLLAKYQPRVVDTLYRAHRQTAVTDEIEDDDPDGSKALAEIESRLEKWRAHMAWQAARTTSDGGEAAAARS